MENQSLFQILIRRWWIFLVVGAITVGATLYLTMGQEPVYKAKATYITKLSPQLGDVRSLSSVLDTLNLQDDLLGTYSEVAMSQMIKDRAIARLGLTGADQRGFTVNSKAVQGTKILEISVEGSNPVLVRYFTEAIGAETVLYVDSLYPAFQLDLLDAPVEPAKPVSPQLEINLVLGLVLGGFLGLSVMFLSAWLAGDFKNLASGGENTLDVPTLMKLREDIRGLREQYESILTGITEGRVLMQNTETEVRSLGYVMNKLISLSQHEEHPRNGNKNTEQEHTR